MLESDQFRAIEDFVRSKSEIKTQLAIEYTFDCKEIASPLFYSKIYGSVYFLVLVVIGTFTVIKYQHLDEQVGEPVQVCTMKLFCCILFLCMLNCLVEMQFLKNCPWTLETVKQSNFLESCKQGF